MDIFLFACLVMGLGIGMDVAIATFMRSHALKQTKTAVIWVVGVTVTHTLFPMIGYLLTYFGLKMLPVLTPLIGVVAFALIAHFLFSEIRDSEDDSESSRSMITIGLILAVSWDALWSGPAKSAQVLGWSEWMIWLSFILVGMVVFIFCIVSLCVARKFFHLKKVNITIRFDWASWVQYSVIGYFGLLALLRYTLNIPLEWHYILLLAFAVMFIVMKRQEQVFEAARQPAQEA